MPALFPHLLVFALPFMFKDASSAFRVVDGPIGTQFLAEFASKGIIGFTWGGAGFQEIPDNGQGDPCAGRHERAEN